MHPRTPSRDCLSVEWCLRAGVGMRAFQFRLPDARVVFPAQPSDWSRSSLAATAHPARGSPSLPASGLPARPQPVAPCLEGAPAPAWPPSPPPPKGRVLASVGAAASQGPWMRRWEPSVLPLPKPQPEVAGSLPRPGRGVPASSLPFIPSPGVTQAVPAVDRMKCWLHDTDLLGK